MPLDMLHHAGPPVRGNYSQGVEDRVGAMARLIGCVEEAVIFRDAVPICPQRSAQGVTYTSVAVREVDRVQYDGFSFLLHGDILPPDPRRIVSAPSRALAGLAQGYPRLHVRAFPEFAGFSLRIATQRRYS